MSTVGELYERSIRLERAGASADEQIEALEQTLTAVHREGLFSANEELGDVHSGNLRYLGLEFQLAIVHGQVGDMARRRSHLLVARELLVSFLRRCEQLHLLHEDEVFQLWAVDPEEDDEGEGGRRAHTYNTDERQRKIDAFRREQSAADRIKALELAMARRREVEDTRDLEDQLREVAVLDLQGKGRCALRELRLIDEEIRLLTHMERMRGQSQQDGNSEVTLAHETASAGSGLGVTYVSSVEGQLLLREETVSAVFKPRMQGPTMSLEEFADIELADALERQAREKNQERSDDGTLRWKHLVEQGLEDDADLADRATVNDREWDAWREANPRGSGNKLGKRF